MGMRSKLLILVVAVVALLGLAACGSDDSDTEATTEAATETTAETTEEVTAEEADGEPLEVRVITALPTNVGLWDPGHRSAYDRIAEEHGWNLQIAEAVEYGRADEVLDRWGQEGVDLVFSTDNGFEDSFMAAAEKFPDTKWAMMSELTDTRGLDNVISYSINWCELGFAIGASAGAITDKQTVGLVGAVPIRPHVLMLESERFGADMINPGTKVLEQNSNDFVDPVLAQETAYSLLDKGADVLVTTHSGPIEQIATAAAERGGYFVGYLADSSDINPDSVVTSVLFDFTYGYEKVAEAVESGNFEPGIHHTGLADGSIQVLPFGLGFEDRQAEVEELLEKLKTREIEFPAGSECEAFN